MTRLLGCAVLFTLLFAACLAPDWVVLRVEEFDDEFRAEGTFVNRLGLPVVFVFVLASVGAIIVRGAWRSVMFVLLHAAAPAIWGSAILVIADPTPVDDRDISVVIGLPSLTLTQTLTGWPYVAALLGVTAHGCLIAATKMWIRPAPLVPARAHVTTASTTGTGSEGTGRSGGASPVPTTGPQAGPSPPYPAPPQHAD